MASESVTFREAAKLIRQGVNPEDVGDMPYIGLEHIEEGTLRLVGIGNAKSVTSTKFRFSKGARRLHPNRNMSQSWSTYFCFQPCMYGY